LRLMADNCRLFQKEWVFLRRNLSGKYNVVPLAARGRGFDWLKGERSRSLADGVYIDFGQPVRIDLIESTVDIIEFFYPNGRFRGKKMEWISYISGTRRELDADPLPGPGDGTA